MTTAVLFTVQEIAEIFRTSRAAVYARLCRARKGLDDFPLPCFGKGKRCYWTQSSRTKQSEASKLDGRFWCPSNRSVNSLTAKKTPTIRAKITTIYRVKKSKKPRCPRLLCRILVGICTIHSR